MSEKKGGTTPPDFFTHFGGFPWFFKVWGHFFSLKGTFFTPSESCIGRGDPSGVGGGVGWGV